MDASSSSVPDDSSGVAGFRDATALTNFLKVVDHDRLDVVGAVSTSSNLAVAKVSLGSARPTPSSGQRLTPTTCASASSASPTSHHAWSLPSSSPMDLPCQQKRTRIGHCWHEVTSRRAVGCYSNPFMNSWKPYRTMMEICKGQRCRTRCAAHFALVVVSVSSLLGRRPYLLSNSAGRAPCLYIYRFTCFLSDYIPRGISRDRAGQRNCSHAAIPCSRVTQRDVT
jgi:hypothetical protein